MKPTEQQLEEWRDRAMAAAEELDDQVDRSARRAMLPWLLASLPLAAFVAWLWRQAVRRGGPRVLVLVDLILEIARVLAEPGKPQLKAVP